MIKSKSAAAGHLTALLTIFIWGTTFISTKILLVDFSPFEILFFRFTIGYIALIAIHPRLTKSKNIREELLFAAAGFCGVTMYFLLENIALTHTLASNVGTLVSVSPFFTALMAHFFLKGEPLRSQFFAGFLVSIFGIILIAFNGNYILKLSPQGDLLAIFSCLFWATYSILMRKISGLGYHTIGCTRRIFFYGLVFMTPALLLSDFHFELSRFTKPVNLLNIIFLGLFASALCFVAWNWCVGILGAVKTSTYIYLVPVITIASSYLILKENITVAALLGTFLTIIGLFLSEKKTKGKILPEEVTAL
ncbi:MAG: multidrug transporter [Clostridiales bacterium]|jgi:drug/metabolite transporter (DMT)-like permease|nr:multidrug transporter [Clostridiales bacterium]